MTLVYELLNDFITLLHVVYIIIIYQILIYHYADFSVNIQFNVRALRYSRVSTCIDFKLIFSNVFVFFFSIKKYVLRTCSQLLLITITVIGYQEYFYKQH